MRESLQPPPMIADVMADDGISWSRLVTAIVLLGLSLAIGYRTAREPPTAQGRAAAGARKRRGGRRACAARSDRRGCAFANPNCRADAESLANDGKRERRAASRRGAAPRRPRCEPFRGHPGPSCPAEAAPCGPRGARAGNKSTKRAHPGPGSRRIPAQSRGRRRAHERGQRLGLPDASGCAATRRTSRRRPQPEAMIVLPRWLRLATAPAARPQGHAQDFLAGAAGAAGALACRTSALTLS